jgi:putative ABC transport system substrate-binding protein
MMKRREFIMLLGGAAAVWPVAAQAQQQSAKVAHLGMLLPSQAGGVSSEWEAITAGLQRLGQLGWIDGDNLRITFKWIASMDFEPLRAHAAQLIGMAPDVVWVLSNPALAALQQTTRTIPTVFVQVADPVGSGFVDSLARPGGNTTGFTNFEDTMGSKWLELLHELAPGTTRALVLRHPETAAHRAFYRTIAAAAPAFGIALTPADIRNAADIERVIASLAEVSNCGLIPLPHPLTVTNADIIIGLAARRGLPAVYAFRHFAASGGLLSYGPDVTDLWRRSAAYVDRILRGARAGDLPVQAPTKFEMVINLKTAKVLGLEVAPTLIARADEVIE